jgi:hypothetical protein
VAIREGQKLVAKNTAPVSHNLVIKGFKNDYNRVISTGRSETFQLVAEPGAINLTCGIHGWMKGFIWVFDNPYFAVTDADGKFEIKNAPSGPVNLVVWQEEAGYGEGGQNGKTIQMNPDTTTELPAIGIKAP